MRKKKSAAAAVGLAPFLLLFGCSNHHTDPTANRNEPREPRPDKKTATTQVGGSSRAMDCRLFVSSKTTMPLRFTTYVPEDVAIDVTSLREGDFLRFTMNINGKRDNDAYLEVYTEVVGTKEAEARQIAHAVAELRGMVPRNTDQLRRYKWSLSEYESVNRGNQNTSTAGWIVLGQRGDRFFYFVASYRAKDSASTLSRIETILREWQWDDNGEGL